jgi:hypothetical protein
VLSQSARFLYRGQAMVKEWFELPYANGTEFWPTNQLYIEDRLDVSVDKLQKCVLRMQLPVFLEHRQ